MYAGLDFGTSYSSIGVWRGDEQELIPLEGNETMIPSQMYSEQHYLPIMEIDQDLFRRRVREAKREQTRQRERAAKDGYGFRELSDEQIRARIRGVLRREMAQSVEASQREATLGQLISRDTTLIFGDNALKQYLRNPEAGRFFKSPKAFLAAPLKSAQRADFVHLISKFLAFIRETAESATDMALDSIVLGRPISFPGTSGAPGDRRAIQILYESATAAGFGDVEFMLEPVAAALDYEQRSNQDSTLLVIDVGGGTTDCSMLRIGPSYRRSVDRTSSVLGHSCYRSGGNKLDYRLAYDAILPHLGMGERGPSGLPIPLTVFVDAISVEDVNAQQRFYETDLQQYVASGSKHLKRLIHVQQRRLSFRILRSSELAKRKLADKASITLPLHYVERELEVDISRADFAESIRGELEQIANAVVEVVRQSGAQPDEVYITGGTARLPIVRQFLSKEFPPSTPLVYGDSFKSVTQGLTLHARNLDRQ